MSKKLTKKNAKIVFDNILAMEDPDMQQQIYDNFNEILNELRDGDAFGTEGQLDPRGDNRQ